MITRRGCLFSGFTAALSSAVARGADFWNSKEPAEWSDDDRNRMLGKSPWAKETTVHFRGDLMANAPGGGGRRGGRGGGMGGGGGMGAENGAGGWGGPGGGAGGMGGPGGGGGGMGGTGGGGGWGRGGGGMGSEGPSAMPEIKTTIRWESAKPVRDARRKPMPAEAADFYIVSVGPLPSGGGQWQGGGGQWQRPAEEGKSGQSPEDRKKAFEDRLKAQTKIERKGHDPMAPARANIIEGPGGRMLLFYFDRKADPIGKDEKDLTFQTALGPMEMKANFAPKDMLYHSELEL